MNIVLICGGVGTKMWPESSPDRPKQFLPLAGDRSTLRINFEQIKKFVYPQKIWVLTTKDLAEMVKKELPEIDGDRYVIEPSRRNHGPAISIMMAKLARMGQDEPFMIIQTDVIREPETSFREMVMTAEEVVNKTGCWLTAGMRVKERVAGVDYIRAGKGKRYGNINFWEVDKWLRRDMEGKIERAMKADRALIHATHLCWTPQKMMKAISQLVPSWGQGMEKLLWCGEKWDEEVEKVYENMEPGSIEDRVVSQTKEPGYVMEMPFEWFDLGTWESVANYSQKYSKNKNRDVIEIGGEGNYCRIPVGKKVALIGCDNLIVVETKQGLLVCRRELSGRVGEVAEKLRN